MVESLKLNNNQNNNQIDLNINSIFDRLSNIKCICNECNNKYIKNAYINNINTTANKIDDYLFLSMNLPIENEQTIEYSFINHHNEKTNQSIAIPINYGIKINKTKLLTIDELKKLISLKFNIPHDELHICDIWKSNIHREYRKKDNIDINRKSDDIFIYHSKKISLTNNYKPINHPDLPTNKYSNITEDIDTSKPRWSTFMILFQKLVPKPLYYHRYYNFRNNRDEEEKYIGYPLLIKLNLNELLTMKMIRNILFKNYIKPFLKDDNIDINNKYYENIFRIEAHWGFIENIILTDANIEFNIERRNMKFIIHFNNGILFNDIYTYRNNRLRNRTAPVKFISSDRDSTSYDNFKAKPFFGEMYLFIYKT